MLRDKVRTTSYTTALANLLQIRQNQQSKSELCEHNLYVTERRRSQRWREREMADREHYRGTLDRGEVKWLPLLSCAQIGLFGSKANCQAPGSMCAPWLPEALFRNNGAGIASVARQTSSPLPTITHQKKPPLSDGLSWPSSPISSPERTTNVVFSCSFD